MTVLVVEDNVLNMELTRDILELHGYDVLEAMDWVECYSVLAAHRPDVILMDVQLPGKDGLQLTRELRSDPRYASLVIVAMTADAMAEDRQEVMKAGCNGYLTKPIDTRTLAHSVATYLLLDPRLAHAAATRDLAPSQIESV